MKILAYSLLVLGPVMMALSRPFTDSLNAPLMCFGAALGMVGLFMRSRVRAGMYPQEIVLLVLTFGILLIFGLTTARGFFLVFGLFSLGLGAVCIARPEWLVYGHKTPERLALNRISCKVSGFMLLPIGVFLILFYWSRLGR